MQKVMIGDAIKSSPGALRMLSMQCLLGRGLTEKQ